ncbi:PadR family transcriptional regulator [Cellulomonas sp. URHD0024]|uniref:PadR family transcriptional regulator n=1 Tax=Cellulomonas sp. URHD0024 TaxID=1302620 RepID=UPI000422C095|nr:PadR family transcriptional regulator [Cellulomonas sp. URHD0024]
MGTYLRLTPALRGVLGCFLAAEAEVWGLLVAKQTGRPTGTIYPLLERLEREGFVRSRWGEDAPGARRRLYTLTPEGHAWATDKLSTGRDVP